MTTLHPIPPDPDHTRRVGVPTFPLVLADGRVWGLALPEPRYRPDSDTSPGDADGQGALRIVVRVGYPWPVERLVERLHAACRSAPDPASDQERFDALMALASALLRRGHDLTPTEAETLLALDPAGSAHLVDAILDAAIRPASPFGPGGADA